MFGYVLAKADEVLVVTGGKNKRVVRGGAFVLPVLRRYVRLSTRQVQTTVTEECFSKENIRVRLTATCSFWVDPSDEGVLAAAARFASDQSQMASLVKQPVSGHLREIAGGMTVQQLVAERETLRREVLSSCKLDLQPMGLAVDSFQVASVETPPDEQGRDYLALLAAPNISERERDSRQATARNEQAAVETEQESLRKQAGFKRDTMIKQAQLDADAAEEQAKADERSQVANADAEGAINAAAARAAQAQALAEAQARQEVVDEQTKLAERNVELTRKRLQAEITEPAEAAKRAAIAQAQAEAEATTLRAKALEEGSRVSLEQQKIALLPELMRAGAEGLRGANITLLNGSDGLADLTAGLITQADALLNVVRNGSSANGAATETPAEGAGGRRRSVIHHGDG